MIRSYRLAAVLLSLMAASGSVVAAKGDGAKLYRWVDADGNVHFSDRVPQEQSGQGHAAFDTEGHKTEEVEKAKSREELQREAEQKKEMERLRKEQEKLIAEQKQQDAKLLNTFQSEEEIDNARNRKLEEVDVQVKFARDTIRQIKKRLEELQGEAADAERQGKQPPVKILDELKTGRERLNAQYTAIVQKEKEKEQIRIAFDKDLERFRTLKNIAQPTQKEEEEKKSRAASLLENLVTCKDDAACNDLWKKAEAYVRKNATTRLVILSDTVIMTAPPASQTDISITVSRLREKGKTEGDVLLFLDVQCHASPGGEELCKGDKVKQIQNGFRPTLTSAEATAAAQPPTAAQPAAPAAPEPPPAAPAPAPVGPDGKPVIKPKLPPK